MLDKVYKRGDKIMVKCADDATRQGTVTGHFREHGVQMFVCVPEGAGRWDGWRTEFAVLGLAGAEPAEVTPCSGE